MNVRSSRQAIYIIWCKFHSQRIQPSLISIISDLLASDIMASLVLISQQHLVDHFFLV